MSHKLRLTLRATDCNGYPSIRILFNNVPHSEHTFTSEDYCTSISVPDEVGTHKLEIIRYGKEIQNCLVDEQGNIVADQTVEIVSVDLDNQVLPWFFLHESTKFIFDNQTIQGANILGPNGVWCMEFSTPIITHILDVKILHEAQYSDDYKYPWAFKLGPNSVKRLSAGYAAAVERISKLND